MDVHDLPFYNTQKCKLFLQQKEDPVDSDNPDGPPTFSLDLCDNVAPPYSQNKPKYRICTRNFTSLCEEVERTDYEFGIEESESSEEENGMDEGHIPFSTGRATDSLKNQKRIERQI